MPEAPKYASVAVPTPLRASFDYRIADAQAVRRGSRVQVPFGRRKLTGIVTAVLERSSVDPARLKNIEAVYDAAGDLPESIVRLCEWAASYYVHPIGEVFANALPTLLRQGRNPAEPVEKLAITVAGTLAPAVYLKKAPAQRHLLSVIADQSMTRDELGESGINAQTIRALLNKNWAEWTSEAPEPMPQFQLKGVRHGDITLTAEQQSAISQIDNAMPVLLHGVTGSGKTEVYLQLIHPLLAAGRQVLVLVPEIGLTPQTISRFEDRFDCPIAVMHSSLTDRERAVNWLRARQGAAGIVLGTRSAIFTPFKDLGAIIVDEEHDTSYKQQDGFRYSARDLAVLRAQFEQVPVILGSATPSLESLHNVETGKYRLLSLTHRPPGAAAESYQLLDTRHLEHHDGFTRALKHGIEAELARGQQVLVFINRRGFAPVLVCNSCQWIAHCRRCDARLTYHLNINTLVCHHCGTMNHNIISCHNCGSSQVSAVGMGTQRIEQTLKQLFPGYPVLRIDRDSTRRKGNLEAFLDEVNRGEPAILVGTQLLAKGHHFPKVTLVALLDVDAGFYSSDFRATERLGQLILQVGGRSGRADNPGRVIIQTDFAEHPLLKDLIGKGYSAFAQDILAERSELALPPYSFCALIKAEAHDASAAREFLEDLVKSARVHPSTNLLGPIPALMEKKAGRFRQILMLTADTRAPLHRNLELLVEHAEAMPAARKVRWSVDVDPTDLF